MSKKSLRLELRQKRASLTSGEQGLAARRLAGQLLRLHCFRTANHVAFYIANDGELNPSNALNFALSLQKNCYLPCLTPQKSLEFRRVYRGTKFNRNRFHILEPLPREKKIAPAMLDIALVPLVAFDRQGSRLGMGGGFYDRTFAFKKSMEVKPILIGLAHSLQEVDKLPKNYWDVTMDFIVTDKDIIAAR